jgi:NADH-quinone oxidoreductase subunit K
MLISFTDIGLILAFLGASGIVINQRNLLISVIAIELMFYGFNLYLITLSVYLDDLMGEMLALFVLTLAAAESALALALLTAYFRTYKDILIWEA